MAANKKTLTIVLASVLGVCVATALAGVATIGFNMGAISESEGKFKREGQAYRRLIEQGEKLSLSQENIDEGKVLVKKLVAAAIERFQIVTAPIRFDMKNDKNGDPTAFSSMLNDQASKLSDLCQESGVQLTNESRMFGFSRYIQGNEKAPQDKLGVLNCQFEVISAIVKDLAKANEKYTKRLRDENILEQDKTVWAKLVSVRRQACELPEAKKRSITKDELTISPKKDGGELGLVEVSDSLSRTRDFITFQRGDHTETFAVQICVATDTGTVRELINELKKYSLYLVDIRVAPASETVFPRAARNTATTTQTPANSFDFGFFGSTPAAPTTVAPRVPAKTTIVEEIPSEFTITLEYFSSFSFDDVNAEKKDVPENEQ